MLDPTIPPPMITTSAVRMRLDRGFRIDSQCIRDPIYVVEVRDHLHGIQDILVLESLRA